MTAQTVDAADRKTADVNAPDNGQRRDDPVLNYRLDVVASDTADVVRLIGGWLYDQTAAGWDVSVLAPQHTDNRPLQIIGARAADLASVLGAPIPASAGHGLVVSPGIFASDARVRDMVRTALACRTTEVALIDGGWPLAVGHRTTAVRHVLSAAARAFKRHALAAAGISSTVEPTETLRSDMTNHLPVASDLIPVL
ncbi:MAG: hypothetical protein WA317_17325 [Mycobacterium sp.]|uniref:hypothetical protein n=1 Tax=Mycobacterium sp. TaxID=1785 RepID=UPI003CC51226